MMKPTRLSFIGLLIFAMVSVSSCGMKSGSSGEASYKPLTTADQKLDGKWMAEKLNSDGDRVVLTLQMGQGERLVSLDAIRSGGDALHVASGSYAIDGNTLNFTFDNIAAYSSPFTVNDKRLTLGTDVYDKVTYDLNSSPQLGGQIQITQAAADESVSVNSVGEGEFVPGEIIVKYKNGNLGKLVLEPKEDAQAALTAQSVPATLSEAAFLTVQKKDIEKKNIEDLKKATLDRIHEIRKLGRVAGAVSGGAALKIAGAGSEEAGEEVEYATPNMIVRVQAAPNDAFYDEQWNLDVLGMVDAWDIAEKTEAVTVAVIDTGIASPLNPDLVGRVLVNYGYDFVSAKVGNDDLQIDGDSGPTGKGPDNNPTDPGDQISNLIAGASSSWHGTHIAGIIAASTNNSFGISGIGTANIKVLPLRAMGIKGSGTLFDVAQAIRYAAKLPNIADCAYTTGTVGNAGQEQTTYNLNQPEVCDYKDRPKAAVINMSLGEAMTADDAKVLNDAVNDAYNAGVVVVSSAGNYGKEPGYCKQPSGASYVWVKNPACNFYPAANPKVISVGAVTPNLVLASYSNKGSATNMTTSVVAPGGAGVDGILSTVSTSVTGGYAELKGTSQAAAHVSAIAAMVVAAIPDNMFNAATVEKVRTYIESSAINLGDVGKDPLYGFGLVNTCGAILKAFGQNGNLGSGAAMHLSSESVNFGTLGTKHNVIVTGGCGGFAVQGITVSKPAADTWLTVAYTSATSPSQVTLTVNRAGLASGDYTSTVTIGSSVGTKTIQVAMKVGAVSTPVDNDSDDGEGDSGGEDEGDQAIKDLTEQVNDFLSDKPGYDNTSDIGEMILVLIDANTSKPVLKTQTDMSANYNFYFGGVPVGQYYLMGGVDENSDGKICDPNSNELCMIYPNPAAPEVIEVTSSTKIEDLVLVY